MGDTLESEFISNFHSLSGETLKERYRNFYSLLDKTQQSLELVSRKIDLSSLTPKTQLEETFKVIALIRFKYVKDLLEVLKSENLPLIDLVFKHSPLIIEHAFNDISPDYLSNELFPNISYNVKLKLLKQLSYHLNDSHKADKYFEAIKEKYGYYLASKLLPSCSSDLIIKSLELYKTEVTPKQLLLILKKYPDLTETFFKKLDQQNSKVRTGEKYQSIFKYLSKKDPAIFIKLYEKYSPNIRLGTRETDFFIKNIMKLNIFENTKLIGILKTKQIEKSLGQDFKNFYFKIFPKRISQVRLNLTDELKLLGYCSKRSENLKIFLITFKEIYGNEVWEYPDLIIPKLIEQMAPDERAVWMENHSRPTNILEHKWMSYYKCEKAVPLLMEKILLTSNMKARNLYIGALLDTCTLNRNKSALLEVLKYINLKHRNDNAMILQNFLFNLELSYNENQLSEEHWKEIFEMVQTYTLNHGFLYCCCHLVEKCIYYAFSHNLPLASYLKYLAKHFITDYNICTKLPKLQKHCLIEFEALVPLGYTKDDEVNRGYLRYMHCVIKYNKHHKDKLVLTMKNEYIESIKWHLESDRNDYSVYEVTCEFIMLDYNKAEDTGILKLFFEDENYYLYHLKAMIFLIKESPLLILKHLNLILKASCVKNFISNFVEQFCTKYTHSEIPQKMTQFCYDIINSEEDNTYKIKTAVEILSILKKPEEYLMFASSFYPPESSPHLDSDANCTRYIKQQAIADNFKHLIPVSQTLEGILYFCKGDYLKFVQRSLEFASLNTVENKLPAFFSTLKDRAVSVKKHAIFLPSRVLSKTQVYHMLLEIMHKEKNSTIRKVIFKTTFHLFLKNSEDYLWTLTKQSLETVDFSDGEAFEILTNCRQVPLQHFDQYMVFTWNFLEKCTTCDKTIENGKLCLLNLVKSTNVYALSCEFCTAVIEQNLFKIEQPPDFQKSILSFTCKYLIYGAGSQEKRLQHIFERFKSFRTKDQDNIKDRAIALKLTYSFVQQLCSDVMDKNCNNRAVFEHFLSMWESILQPHEAFDEFLHLQFTSLYLNALDKKLTIDKIGEKVAAICNLLYEQNCLVVKHFSWSLNEFLGVFYELESVGHSDESEICFIESIVKHRKNIACLELAVSLLPYAIPVAPVVKEKYNYIVDIITKEQNRLLQVDFLSYLRNITYPNV